VARKLGRATIDAQQMPNERHPSDHLPLAACFDFYVSTRSKVAEIIAVESESRLRMLLAEEGVAVDRWGGGGAKTIADLMGELSNRDCFMSRRPSDGRLVRVLEYAEVELGRADGRILVETHQSVAGGGTRKVDSLLTGKKRAGEVWQMCIARSGAEKLKLPLSNVPYTIFEETYTATSTEKEAFSYPGLLCQYRKHRVKAELQQAQLPRNSPLELDSFATDGAGTGAKVAQHHWAWRTPEEWAALRKPEDTAPVGTPSRPAAPADAPTSRQS